MVDASARQPMQPKAVHEITSLETLDVDRPVSWSDDRSNAQQPLLVLCSILIIETK